MAKLQYLGRQPILDKESHIISYDLFYRDQHLASNFENPRFATASVLVSVLNKFGIKNILGTKKALIRSDESFLMHDLIFSIPKEHFSFSVIVSQELNERNVERLEQLKERGYSVGINDITIDAISLAYILPIIKYINYIKIDTIFSDMQSVLELLKLTKKHNIQTIATKIETNQVYELYQSIGATAYQGYFFAKPNIIENAVIDPNKMTVFKIYKLLLDESSIKEIVKVFEENHAITIQLLQYINSPMFSFKKNISSIEQVITLVGRMPLSQWLLMSVYSKAINNSTGISALMLQVKARTELMSGLSEYIDKSLVSQAYFVGVLSLLDSLFFMSLPDVLRQLNVDSKVSDALLLKKGILGEIYQVVLDIEQFDTQKIDMFCERHHIKEENFEILMALHMHKVNELDEAFSA